MTRWFSASDREQWAALIDEALRLNNVKVQDMGPLKRAAARCLRVTLPVGWQGQTGNPLSRLIRAAQNVRPGDAIARQMVIDMAWGALRGMMPPGQDSAVDYAAIRQGILHNPKRRTAWVRRALGMQAQPAAEAVNVPEAWRTRRDIAGDE